MIKVADAGKRKHYSSNSRPDRKSALDREHIGGVSDVPFWSTNEVRSKGDGSPDWVSRIGPMVISQPNPHGIDGREDIMLRCRCHHASSFFVQVYYKGPSIA